MKYEDFIKEASKYSKEAILKTFKRHCFMEDNEVLKDIKFNDLGLKFDKLMVQSNEIVKEIKSISNGKDIESRIKVFSLMKKDDLIQKKIDKVMKEIDSANS